MSPLMVDGLCVVHVGVDSQGEMIALDAETGEPRWSFNGDGPSYSSPIVLSRRGERQLVALVSQAVVGLDLKTGMLVWRYPFRTTNTQNIVTPLDCGNLLIVGGIGQPTTALRVPWGAGERAETVWSSGEAPLHMSSPVVVNDRIFGFSQRKAGCLFSIDAATGETRWQSEGRLGENTALLRAGPWLVVLRNKGQLTFARTDASGYQPIAEYRVSPRQTWAHPILVGKRIVVKDTEALACWSIRP